MPDLEAFADALDGVPLTADAAEVVRMSRDNFAVSPVLRKQLAGRSAALAVAPRDRAELLRVLAAAARHRVPLVPRGAGTANYGQSVPGAGAALLDLRRPAGILWHRPGLVRCLAGTRMDRLDDALRPHGWELRLHPSTRRESTVAGFLCGGSGGMGSGMWGLLRDRGNVTALELLSLEEVPRSIELRGADVALALHAYGTTGIVTEVELPLAPAHPWREVVLAFRDWRRAVGYALRLVRERGLLKKLTSIQEWPAPAMMRALGGVVPEGRTAVLAMLAEPTRAAADDLMREWGGEVVADHAEGENPFGAPLFEFSWGHGLRQIQRSHPRTARLQASFGGPEVEARLLALHERLGHVGPLCAEVFLSGGEVVGMGSPYIPFEGEAALAALADELRALGASVANNHATGLRAVGFKRLGPRDLLFKREMDPHGLLNPGQMEDADAGGPPPGEATGWRFRRAG